MNAAFFSNIKKGKDFAGIKSENSAVIYSGKSLPATNAGALRGRQPPLEGVASNAVRAAAQAQPSPRLAKNSPPDCFSRFAGRSLRGRLPPHLYSKVSTVKF